MRLASFIVFMMIVSIEGFAAGAKEPKAEVKAAVMEGAFKPLTDSSAGLAKSLTLRGSRRESLNFVISIEGLRSCVPLKVVSVGNNKGTRDLDFRFYRMESIALRKKSFASARKGEHYDPLLPLKDGTICPDASKKALGSARLWVWGEVAIQETATAGDRELRLSAGDQATVPVSLRIWKMTMPAEPSLKLYAEFSPYGGVIGHYGKWNEAEGELAGRYYRVMLDHGIVPLNGWLKVPDIKTSPVVAAGATAPVQPAGKSRAIARRMLDLETSPSMRDSYQNLLLRSLPPWANIQFPGRMDLIPKEKRIEHFEAVENTISDHKLKGRAFVYLSDEPKEKDMPELIEASVVARKKAPSLKILAVTDFRPSLREGIDIFVVPMNHVASHPVPANVESWWYVSCMSHGCEDDKDSGFPDFVIERETSSIRSIGWLTEKAGISNFLYYQLNYAYKELPSQDPWKDQWAFTGNGDGNLFYPGRKGERGFALHEPVTSIRLKTWRETAFDHRYLGWFKADPRSRTTAEGIAISGEIEKLRKGLNQFEPDRAKYQSVRNRIGDFLNEAKEKSK